MPPCGGHRNISQKFKHYKRFKSCPRVGGICPPLPEKDYEYSFKSCPRVGGILRQKECRKKQESFKSCPRVGGIRNCT